MKKIITIIMIITVITVITKPVYAQTSSSILSISPVIFNITLSPGKTFEEIITVQNLLDLPLPLRIDLADFDQSGEEGDFKFNNNQTSPLLTWISVEPKEMILPAKSIKTIPIKIHVPGSVQLGGYYGLMFLQPLLPNLPGYPPDVSAKIGVLFLANIGVQTVTGKKAEILDFSFNKAMYEKGPVETNFRVKNSSLNHFSAKPFLFIKPLFGEEKQIDIEEKIILPGKIRHWKNQFDLPTYWQGIYQVTLKVSTGNGEYVTKTDYLVGFPFGMIFLILSLVAVLALLILRRKKLKKAVSILVKGR